MIDQMEGQVQAGVQHVGVDVIQGYLDRMSESEEAFVQVVDEQLPTLTAQLSSLPIQQACPAACLRHPFEKSTQLEPKPSRSTSLRP